MNPITEVISSLFPSGSGCGPGRTSFPHGGTLYRRSGQKARTFSDAGGRGAEPAAYPGGGAFTAAPPFGRLGRPDSFFLIKWKSLSPESSEWIVWLYPDNRRAGGFTSVGTGVETILSSRSPIRLSSTGTLFFLSVSLFSGAEPSSPFLLF